MIAARRLWAGMAAGAAALALASGCAAPARDAQIAVSPPAPAAEPAPAPPSPPSAAPAGKAARVAAALVLADKAERAGDVAGLAQAATALERLGASPQTADDAAVMQRWRASLPGDAPPLRGRALGPAYRSGALGPGATTRLNQTFLGGRAAQIVLRVANGPAPLLVVRDGANRQICAADDDPATCRWVPLYTQRHEIEIVNNGPQRSKFYVIFD